MKKLLNGKYNIILLFAFAMLVSCTNKKEAAHSHDVEYTCPMHPQIIRNEPGSCPICGMDLVAKKSSEGQANDSLANITKPVNSLVLSSIKTTKAHSGSRYGDIQARGVINYNPNNSNSISARVSGRIEHLYVKYNYQAISKGQKLMDIYSPDLANAQQELLFLRDNNEPQLLEAAKKKLRLLGASEQQINMVLKTGKINNTISIYSSYSGYISESSQAAGGAASAGSTVISSGNNREEMGMNTSTPTPVAQNISSNDPLQLREGQYVSAGQRLFAVVNSETVWAEFYTTSANLGVFKKGKQIAIQSEDINDKHASATVSLVQPYYKEGANYSLVRALIRNRNNAWKIGELIKVTPENTKESGNWLPRTAVVQLGTRYVSFVKQTDAFVPVYVTVKNFSGDWADIGESLKGDEDVAINAWFLVDTESFIKAERL